jgi:hypothetical protein
MRLEAIEVVAEEVEVRIEVVEVGRGELLLVVAVVEGEEVVVVGIEVTAAVLAVQVGVAVEKEVVVEEVEVGHLEHRDQEQEEPGAARLTTN